MSLANPERDAKLLTDAFNRSGFEKVQLVIDGTRDGLLAALKSFAADAANADWAVVYYAGHGIELDGSNYLVPIDVKYEDDADIPKESLALDEILNAVGAASKLRPLFSTLAGKSVRGGIERRAGSGAGRGLARIEPERGRLLRSRPSTDICNRWHWRGQPVRHCVGQPYRKCLGWKSVNCFAWCTTTSIPPPIGKQEPFTYGQLGTRVLFQGKVAYPWQAHSQFSRPARSHWLSCRCSQQGYGCHDRGEGKKELATGIHVL